MIAPWYVMAYTQLDRIAMRHGYALALHGSMARDLDLIAVPWTDDADDPETLIMAFNKFIIYKAHVEIKGKFHATKKPHGRLAYSLSIGYDGHYLDVSVMPRIIKPDFQGLAKNFIKEHNEISETAQIDWQEKAAILLFATWLDKEKEQ